jgi:hypothetical protein
MNVRQSSLRKYEAVQRRFAELYNKKRLRLDDVEAKLSEEFYLSRSRLSVILKMDLNPA